MLIDTDAPSIVETWKAMIEVQKTGKAKSIGVSNFTVEHLEKIIKATGVVPAMNQIEAHPALQQTELEKYCEEKGIKLTAYSPLGNNVSGLFNAKKGTNADEIRTSRSLAKRASSTRPWCRSWRPSRTVTRHRS